MTLYDGQKDGQYTVNGLYLEEGITRRLQALGLNDGTTVKVLNRRKKGAMIIQVRGTRLALGKHIAAGIEVVSGSKEEAGKEGRSYDAN
ncbi:MAG: ferrous iron transport protein A [Lachnospiraceae bacterium]|nr:ferrous iron transport protein A [Lachnospiraceae bacterium]